MSDHPGKIVTVVQARMDSTRLPGKVMEDIHGAPMLARVVNRSARAASSDALVVATTTRPSDDVIAEWCATNGIVCARGHATDVLDRFHETAHRVGAGAIVRITADCPLIDPQVIDRTVEAFLSAQPAVDFAANRLPDQRTYPIGLDVEVCTCAALDRAWTEARHAYQREHVMPYLYDEPGRFRVLVISNDVDLGHMRWTVDTAQDLKFVRVIYEAFQGQDDFSMEEVLDLLSRHPEILEINAQISQKGFRSEE